MAQNPALPTLRPFIAGDWIDGDDAVSPLADKFTDETVAYVQASSPAQVTALIDAAAARADGPALPLAERARILHTASALVAARRDELIALVQLDAGFTLADAVKEVDRTSETLRLCAEETTRLVGEMLPLSGVAGHEGRIAYTRYDAIGIVVAITPFNSPLNTVAHKVGPAIGAGNSVILKPASQTPLSADALLRILLDAGLPPEMISVVYGSGAVVGSALAADPRPGYYAFTGSTRVGEELHRSVGMRRTQLEMGSIASTIICADADLERAAMLATNASFRKSGQVCTSVQRLYVHRDVLDEVAQLMAERLAPLRAGDPRDDTTFVGPLIAPREAERVRSWIDEAVARGADVVAGGTSDGNVVAPTVLRNTRADDAVMRSEVFGPVVSLCPFDTLEDAITQANATEYGLASGIFTRDIGTALTAADRLKAGSVHINETSSSRVDMMPFGGLKRSGFGGTEGPKYAIRDMSEERVVTLSRP